jgi:hypothetical protein
MNTQTRFFNCLVTETYGKPNLSTRRQYRRTAKRSWPSKLKWSKGEKLRETVYQRWGYRKVVFEHKMLGLVPGAKN